jgi:hypothetical protein
MQDVYSLGYETVHMGLRASRVAVVFDASGHNWPKWARVLLHEFSQIWGGSGFILIPHIDGEVHPWLAEALRKYDPDYVLLYRPRIQEVEQIESPEWKRDDGGPLSPEERQQFLNSAGHDRIGLSAKGTMARDSLAELCSPYTRNLDEQESEHETLFTTRSKQRYFIRRETSTEAHGQITLAVPSEFQGTLALAAAMRCGSLDDPIFDSDQDFDADQKKDIVRWLLRHDFGEPDILLRGVAKHFGYQQLRELRMTTFDATNAGLVQVRSGHPTATTCLVVVGNSPNDFAIALAWDRIYGNSKWLAPEWSTSSETLEGIIGYLDGASWPSNDVQQWDVVSCSDDRHVSTVVAAMQRSAREQVPTPSAAETQKIVRSPDRPNFSLDGTLHLAIDEQWSSNHLVPVSRSADGAVSMVGPGPMPLPENPTIASYPGLGWQVDIRFPSPTLPPGQRIPMRALIAEQAEQFLTWVRSSRAGISYESHRFDFISAGTPVAQQLARPRLRQPSLAESIALVATRAGLIAELSAAGKQAEVVAGLWGGRDRLTAASSAKRQLLRSFVVTVKNSSAAYPNNEGVVIGENRDGFVHFDGLMTLAEGTLSTAEMRSRLDELIRVGALRRGLVLGCEICGLVEFVPLQVLSESNLCRRCGRPNLLTAARWRSDTDEPRWFYDLHGAFRELLRNDGDVPLLLSDYLRSRSRSFTDIPEFQFRRADNGKLEVEVDLIALAGDRLIIAEAKSNGSLKSSKETAKQAADKKITAALKLGADQIIFATTASIWEPASTKAMLSAAGITWPATARRPVLRLIAGLGGQTISDELLAPNGTTTSWSEPHS